MGSWERKPFIFFLFLEGKIPASVTFLELQRADSNNCSSREEQPRNHLRQDSLRPRGLQHVRPPCPTPTPRACSNSCPLSSVMPSNHLILCCPLFLLPSIFPNFRVFSNESVLHIRWPKYGSFSFSISPSSEYSGLISLRMDWLDLFAGHGTLKSLLQHHSSKASVLLCSAFFIVQLSHPYMTTGKIALTRWTFVDKVMSLFLICCLG